jgi:GTP-binding protein EngB required for normal cell division
MYSDLLSSPSSLIVRRFCLDSDVSRIEEADKRTFETIAQFSHHVPVFVVGTKKDKLVAYRKMELLEKYMASTGDFKEASRLATADADKLADEQFQALREQLSKIPHYKADGYSCISKGSIVPVSRCAPD